MGREVDLGPCASWIGMISRSGDGMEGQPELDRRWTLRKIIECSVVMITWL